MRHFHAPQPSSLLFFVCVQPFSLFFRNFAPFHRVTVHEWQIASTLGERDREKNLEA